MYTMATCNQKKSYICPNFPENALSITREILSLGIGTPNIHSTGARKVTEIQIKVDFKSLRVSWKTEVMEKIHQRDSIPNHDGFSLGIQDL